jgi:acyl-CoA synthetase (AMP-forming)/AMP-acid ligase II
MSRIRELSVPVILQTHARRIPESTAILAPGRKPLSYKDLFEQASYVVSKLNELGVDRNDNVAIVLPNGPEMAVAFLTVACGASSAPLNPGYGANEFDFYLADLNARALILLTGMDSPARDVAVGRGIPIIDLIPSMGLGLGNSRFRTALETSQAGLDLRKIRMSPWCCTLRGQLHALRWCR